MHITLFDAAQQVRERQGGQRVRIDMTGKTFGELTVLSFSHVDKKKTAHWVVRCGCGVEKSVSGCDLRAGKILSCGHLKRDSGRRNQYKHGHAARDGKTKTYRAWRNMISRCTEQSNKHFRNYGGRGISVCKDWLGSFEKFLHDIGEIPEGMSLERIDPDGDYHPANCKLIPLADQVRNRRITIWVNHDGREKPLSVACAEAGIPYKLALQRHSRGQPIDQVLYKGKL
ncbi:hypothetical protein N5C12_09815 [Comamonas aquatica]|uniref:hypothetical protein n=1 Tax=Comamonas aquatica TaxID=225991 RepID=UPI002447C5B8|nr:hypothetical protein [Comamonas aquatica]MDH0899647.1 hypothetical protein [Comamonas aquatica]